MSTWCCWTPHSAADTRFYWNGGGGQWSSGPGDKNWNLTAAGAGGDLSWPNTGTEVAIFQDAVGGTLSIFGDVQVAGIVANGANYRLEAGNLRWVAGPGGAAPSIEVHHGTLHIDAGLEGSAGWVKRGLGDLLLSGSNSYSGETWLQQGSLIAGRANVFSPFDRLAVDAGATLNLNGYDQTVGDLVSHGHITGAGTLQAASYLLGDGAVVSGNLGEGSLMTFGDVLVTGTTAAMAIEIGSGNLQTTGDNFVDAAAVTLQPGGTWQLEGSETVGSFASRGRLAGAGQLSADRYLLNDGSRVTARLGDGEIVANGQVELAGTSGAGSLRIVTGTTHFTGTSAAEEIGVQSGATLQWVGDLGNHAVVRSAGSIEMATNDTIASYISQGGSLSGIGMLTADTYLLLAGSVVNGQLGTGQLITRGEVALRGTSAASQIHVENGVLTLLGSERLADTAVLAVSGQLDITGTESVRHLEVRGGRVTGGGLVAATTYDFKDGSEIEVSLRGGSVLSSGVVKLSGSTATDVIRVTSGVMIHSGSLGTASSALELAGGARLVAGDHQFQILTTLGSEAAIWQGTLENHGMVAAGAPGSAGVLRVEGDYINHSGARLAVDVGSTTSDLLQVSGLAQLGGTLELTQLGSDPIPAWVPHTMIDAGSLRGNFSTLNEDLEGTVIFNPFNGTITRLAARPGLGVLDGLTANQKSAWIALYDDVIDPGVTNVISRPGQTPALEITSGIANIDAPELLHALNASLTPSGLDGELLSALSPESYLAVLDYALQATRLHRRTAHDTLSLPRGESSRSGKDSAKSSSMGSDFGFHLPEAWDLFAAVDGFDGGTDGSRNGADYDLRGAGFLIGGRWQASAPVGIAVFLAGNHGEIQGQRLDADVAGWVTGVSSRWLVDSRYQLSLHGGISYGHFEFDGDRRGVKATASGWQSGNARFTGVDAKALDLFLAVDGVVFQENGFRIVPSLGLNYRSATSDAFREHSGGALPLAVRSMSREALVSELALAVQYDVDAAVTLEAQVGGQLDWLNSDEEVMARFKSGQRSIAASGTPMADELLFGSMGVMWRPMEHLRIGGTYRLEVRGDADLLHSLGISSTFRF
jgi:autotransporter-associated beta strand protein